MRFCCGIGTARHRIALKWSPCQKKFSLTTGTFYMITLPTSGQAGRSSTSSMNGRKRCGIPLGA